MLDLMTFGYNCQDKKNYKNILKKLSSPKKKKGSGK